MENSDNEFFFSACMKTRLCARKLQRMMKGDDCDKCKVIKRKGIIRIICENPKHKQRQG